MSQERDVIAEVKGTPIRSSMNHDNDGPVRELDASAAEAPKPTSASREERKARMIQILERSPVQDQLNVKLPADKYGEWVRNNPMEINRMQALGFQVDRQYASSNALHGGTGDEAVIGDVIFMTCEKDTKELIDEIRHDRFLKANGKRKEEEELKRNIRGGTDGEIPAIVEGSERPLTPEGLAAAVNNIDRQTSIQ